MSQEQLLTVAVRILDSEFPTDHPHQENAEPTILLAKELFNYVGNLKIDVAQFLQKHLDQNTQSWAQKFYACFKGHLSIDMRGNRLSIVDEDKLLEKLKAYKTAWDTDAKKHQELSKQNKSVMGILAKLKSGQAVSKQEWAATNDIDIALRIFLGREKFKRHIMATQALAGINAESVQECDAQASRKRPYCVVAHVDGNHWVFLKVGGEGNEKKLNYKDSFSRSDEYKAQKLAQLKKAFPGYEIEMEFTGEQKNGWACGDFAIAEVLKSLGEENHEFVRAPTPEARREILFKALEAEAKKTADYTSDVQPSDSKDFVISQEVFARVFKDVDAKLQEDGRTISTTKLDAENIDKIVERMAQVMKECHLGKEIDGKMVYEVDLTTPEKSQKAFEDACAKHGLTIKAKKVLPNVEEKKAASREEPAEMLKKMLGK